jgi:hypothetical protein
MPEIRLHFGKTSYDTKHLLWPDPPNVSNTEQKNQRDNYKYSFHRISY